MRLTGQIRQEDEERQLKQRAAWSRVATFGCSVFQG